MSPTEPYLKRIQAKIQQLLKQHSTLQQENHALKTALSAAQKSMRECQEKAGQLQQQVEILKLSAGEMTAGEKKQFEKRIHNYLKEIDRCIALLSE